MRLLSTLLIIGSVGAASGQAAAQCISGGAGGVIPASGTGGGGAFPTILPPSPFTSTLAVTMPVGATVLKSVKLNGVTHTWSGDVQFILQDPAGGLHNLICGMNADPGNDFGGNYEIVDPVQGNACAGGFPMFSYTNGDPIAPGTYTQNFGDFVSGSAGVNNTPIEAIPATSGNWTLFAYDWVGADVGAITDWELCFGTPTVPPPPPPPPYPTSMQCVTGGVGTPFPLSGAVDGVWPTTLPTGEMASTAAITVPPGSTKIVAVKLIGLSHTWVTDPMIVLTDPAGGRHMLFQADDGSNCGGCADDFSGDYEIVDAVAGSGSPCLGGNAAVPMCVSTTVPPGRYLQNFGAWPSGSSGINNTLLESIPVSSGNWTLTIYDWCITFDNGSLTGWDLCFDTPSGPTTYCTSGTSTNGCVPAISATAQPSATLANPCVINVANVEGAKSGLIFYSITGQNALIWGAGSNSYLCVKAPTQRMQTQNSGGNAGLCDGALSQDWNAYQLGNPTALGNPFSAGQLVQAQAWYRDPPAPKTTNLSGGLEMTVQP